MAHSQATAQMKLEEIPSFLAFVRAQLSTEKDWAVARLGGGEAARPCCLNLTIASSPQSPWNEPQKKAKSILNTYKLNVT